MGKLKCITAGTV